MAEARGSLAMTRAPGARTAGVAHALVGLACLALTLALYHRALGFYFVGDDIGFVHPDSHWLRTALLPGGEWHYYPLTQLSFALLGIWSDWRPAPLHLLNLLLHAAVGLGLALWLTRFGIAAWARLMVALFFVSRGIHYEVVTWITELSYLAVALYTLVTLACWDRFLRGYGHRYFVAAVAAFTAAVFTIEHALILAPLCAMYDLTMRPGADSRPEQTAAARTSRWSRLRWRALPEDSLKYLPFVLVALSFLALKRSHHIQLLWSGAVAAGTVAAPTVPSGMDVTLRLPAERLWLGILNTPRRAYQDLLAATSYLVLPSGLCHGATDTSLTRHPWISLLPWLGVQLGIVWKGSPLARFLLAWVYVYELPLAIAGVPQARYLYMASMPAAALVGLGVVAAHQRLRRAAWRRVFAAGAAILMVAMILGEARFIRARLDEWKQASDMVRTAVDELQRGLPAEVEDLYLVNLPRGIPGPIWPAYTFANAAEHLPRMLRPPREARVHMVYDRSFVEGRWPTIGAYAPREEIARRSREPKAYGYEFITRPPWIAPLR